MTNAPASITLTLAWKAARRSRAARRQGRGGDEEFRIVYRGNTVSIVRIGLAETKGFAGGYDAIFGGQKKAATPAKKAKPTAKKAGTGKKKAGKKKPPARK